MKRLPVRVVAGAVLLVALLLGGVASYYASSAPDGLSRVAADQGIDRHEGTHASEDSPLAGYEADGVGDARLSKGMAGVIGVGVVLLLGSGLSFALRRRPTAGAGSERPAEPAPAERA